MTRDFFSSTLPRFFFAWMLMIASLAAGEVRTFTSKDGRAIEAELLGFRDDALRVRRTDTNKEFRVSLSGPGGADPE